VVRSSQREVGKGKGEKKKEGGEMRRCYKHQGNTFPSHLFFLPMGQKGGGEGEKGNGI